MQESEREAWLAQLVERRYGRTTKATYDGLLDVLREAYEAGAAAGRGAESARGMANRSNVVAGSR
jgi:hypothetical protein